MKNETAPSGPQPAGGIIWRDVYARVEAARAAAEQGRGATSEARQRILRDRRKALARRPGEAAPGAYVDVVVFRVADETYAVASACVREVCPLRALTPLPCTPPFVAGIVNVRGEMLSVVDLKSFFDLPAKGLTDLNRVVVLSAGDMVFGVLADSVAGARRIMLDEMQASLPTLTGVREDYLKGVTADRVVVLDAEKLLSDTRLVVYEEA